MARKGGGRPFGDQAVIQAWLCSHRALARSGRLAGAPPRNPLRWPPVTMNVRPASSADAADANPPVATSSWQPDDSLTGALGCGAAACPGPPDQVQLLAVRRIGLRLGERPRGHEPAEDVLLAGPRPGEVQDRVVGGRP